MPRLRLAMIGVIVAGATCWGGGVRWRAVVVFAGALALVGGWWRTIRPSNDRDWPDVAVLPHTTIRGDLVTVHNVRNFDYRTESDFTPRYDDRTFDLRQLDRVDLVAVYWMGPGQRPTPAACAG